MKDFFTGEKTPGMIDWASMPTYNTIMSLVAGAGLIALVMFARDLMRQQSALASRPVAGAADVEAGPRGEIAPVEDGLSTDGWALTFGVLGLILSVTGLHMTLTWPLAAGGFAFDNIIFGEPSLAFGVLMGALALYLWRRGDRITGSAQPVRMVARAARPLSVLIAGLGLALLGIMFAGIVYQFFAAPPQEPISGAFADYPWLEAWALSLVFGLVGVGALLFPFAVRQLAAPTPAGTAATPGGAAKAAGWIWLITGVIFLLFGAMNLYTHIGLVVNTQ